MYFWAFYGSFTRDVIDTYASERRKEGRKARNRE